MEQTLFIILFCIVILGFLADKVIDNLNVSYWSDVLPERLKAFYNESKYKKAQQYEKEKHYLNLFSSSLSFVLLLIVIISGFFGQIDLFLRQYTQNPIWLALLFFGLIGWAGDLLSIPFEMYRIFRIEEQFGFNKTTVRTYLFDKLKGWLLGGIIGGGLLALIVWIYQSTGSWFWVLAWLLIGLFSVFISMFYSTLIVPLFNKQKPLESGELRLAIENFASKAGFQLDNIYVIDGSKRSSKGNAYFSGLGPQKRIVLFDTLIANHSTEELVAVLAHEIGHYQKKHTRQGMFLGLLQSGIMLFILSRCIQPGAELTHALASILGGTQASFHLGILAFGLLYSPLSQILGIGMNYLSRKNEYAADNYAASFQQSEALQAALIKLSTHHLSNLQPHPVYVFIHYSHPPLLKRLENLEAQK